MELNQVNLARMIIELQDLMRLNDVDIEGEIVSKDHMLVKYGEDSMVHGYYEIARSINKAFIFINEDCEEWEQTVIHEMVHVVCDQFLAYIERKKQLDSFGDTVFEQMIERLSVGFLNAWIDNECLLDDD